MENISTIVKLKGRKIKVHLVPYKTGYRVYAKFMKNGMVNDVIRHTQITKLVKKETKDIYTILETMRNPKGTIFGYIKYINKEPVPEDCNTEYSFTRKKYEELKNDKTN